MASSSTPSNPFHAGMNPASIFSERALRTQPPPISWLMKVVVENPEIISLAAGFVDQSSLPNDLMKELMQELFSNPTAARASLQYGITSGLPSLRATMAARLVEHYGLPGPVTADDVVITNGSQQLLHLVADVLIDPGDIVLVEDPTYFVFLGVLEAVGARVMGVATDEDGMIPEALEEKLKELKASGDLNRLKMIYVMSYFQNPMGVTLESSRREKIVRIAEHWGGADGRFVLLEDAAYRELRIDGPDLPYLKTFDPENKWIVLTGTFSKAFTPGVRLGWGYVPQWLMEAILRQKGNEDFGSTNLGQTLTALALERGFYDRQKERVQQRYRQKRDVLIEALKQYWPSEIRYPIPHGGLYVWATLPEGISSAPHTPFFDECLARKVIYVPGVHCFCPEPGVNKPENQLRLCYGYIEDEPMIEGVRRMGEAMAAVLERASL